MTPPDEEVAGLDVPAVTGWIGRLGVTDAEPLTFRRIGAGQSNLTFLVTDARGAHLVLRRPPLGQLLDSAHDVEREHRVLTGLQGTDVPTPRVLGLCTDERVTHVPLLLMEHVDGIVLDSGTIARRLAPEQRATVGASLARTLAAVHAVDLDAAGLADLGSRSPYAARQLRRWHGQWQRSSTRAVPAVDELAQRLADALPAPGEVVLVHGDFHLLNVIVDPDSAAVAAVLDWELCTLGDPIADLGGLLAYWPEPDDPPGAVIDVPRLDGFPRRAELAASYAEASGRALDHLAFWHVLALWKIAIIAEGVLRRRRDEPRNRAPGDIDLDTVDQLLARAKQVADDAGL